MPALAGVYAMTRTEKISAARTKLVAMHPFWSVFALRQKIELRDNVKEMATDGITLALNPEFVDSCDAEKLAAGIALAAAHVALGHHTRQGQREQQDWQQAAHETAMHALKTVPYWTGKAKQDYDNLSAEDVYALIHRKKPEKPQDQPNQQQQPNPAGNQGNGPGQGNQPSSQPGTPGADPAVELQTPADPQTADNDRKEMLRIAARAEAGRRAGSIPDALKELIRSAEKPAVDWREELAALATAEARNEYQWTRPNRRHIADGLYLPSLGGVELAPLIVAIDVSGSTGPYIPVFLAAVDDIMAQHPGLKIQIITCNTKIQEQELFEDAPIRKEWKCGGGTRFAPIFRAVEGWTDPDTGREPAGIAILTDLEAPDLKELQEPETPVLWAVFGGRKDIPFGTRVHIPLDTATHEN